MRAAELLAVLALVAAVGMGPYVPGPRAHAAVLSQDEPEDAAPEQAGPEDAEEAEPAADVFPAWLPPGGLYGRHKWVPGSNGVDVFLPRGTEVRAPVAGLVVAPAAVVLPFPPPVPSVALRGDSGLSFFMGHVQPLVYPGTQVQAGDLLAVIDDPGLDQLTSAGPGPSGWQHVDLNVSDVGAFTWYGGDVPASQWLQGTGYQGTLVDRTPGPVQVE
ncbi:MAG TPA: hypothetical protein VK066_21995 [Chloroflexota bacterium]|nr:hypothetical protein [Chloroflexota bacterium]